MKNYNGQSTFQMLQNKANSTLGFLQRNLKKLPTLHQKLLL